MVPEQNDKASCNAKPHVNPQICVCFDVYQDEIVEQILSGEQDLNKISDATYACQGCGSCAVKIEKLITEYAPNPKNT